MTDFLQLAVRGVRDLQPYQPGKPIEELEREYGITGAIKLASNENPMGPSPRALAALHRSMTELSRYPDGNGFGLKRALADLHGITAGQITLGNGSNDVLELLARAFVAEGEEVVFSEHAFAVYPIATRAVGGRAVITPASNWGHDLDAMAGAVTERTKLMFVANPNNPTGTWLQATEIEQFLQRVPQQVLVVLDEAYFEYASDPELGAEGYGSAMALLERHPNLVVTRTFSKAYGLAGLRVGYAVSTPQVADILNRVRQPFNTNLPALAAAEEALLDRDYLQRSLRLNREGMSDLYAAFDELSLRFIPSAGNFISFDVGRPAAEAYEALLKKGVIVRPVANYGMPNYLRVTIGLPEENERFVAALREIL